MSVAAAIRLAGNLNALRVGAVSAEVAAREVVDDDVAHHVIDAQGLLGLDPLGANDLEEALRSALLLTSSLPDAHAPQWILALPRPGALAPLRGPAELNATALAAEVAVVPAAGGPAWVPHEVGQAVQWQVLPANRPAFPETPADADRHLSEVVLRAGQTLAELDMSSGQRPAYAHPQLPATYPERSQKSAHRAMLLLAAADAGLEDHSGLLHSHAIGVRRQVLTELRNAAAAALSAAVSWPG